MKIESEVSTIRVSDRGDIRTLYFRRDDGRQAIESQMDMREPHRLRLRYTRSMFASYLFVPDPQRVLIIGLGGGAMVRFLERYEPTLFVDAVDVDPAVVALSTAHFGARASAHIRLIAADGLRHLQDAEDGCYDVVYLDAFLGGRQTTDDSGVPLHLKTPAFHALVRRKLGRSGVAVFNLHLERGLAAEVAPLRRAYGGAHRFEVPRSRNHVIVATNAGTTADLPALRAAAAVADPRFLGEFSVLPFIDDLRDGETD